MVCMNGNRRAGRSALAAAVTLLLIVFGVLLPLAGLIGAVTGAFVGSVAAPLFPSPYAAPGGCALIGMAAFTGPVVHGMDQSVHTLRLNGAPVALKVREAIRELRGPGTVYLVVPVRGTYDDARQGEDDEETERLHGDLMGMRGGRLGHDGGEARRTNEGRGTSF